jgi:hypothetical protein
MSLRVEDAIAKLDTLPSASSEDSVFFFTILEVVVPQLQAHEGTEDKVLDLKYATLANLDNARLLLHRVLEILYHDQSDKTMQTYQGLKTLANLHDTCPQVRLVLLRNSLLGPCMQASFLSVMEEIAIECNNACLYECEASAYELVAESGQLAGAQLIESLDMASRAYFKVFNDRCIYISKRVVSLAASGLDKDLFHYYLDHFAFTLRRFGRHNEANAIRRQVREAFSSATDPALLYRRARADFFLGDFSGAESGLRDLCEHSCEHSCEQSDLLLRGKILFLLARCLVRQGKPVEANQMARECFRVRGRVPSMPKHILCKTLELVRKTQSL